jgi:hypothetical protein
MKKIITALGICFSISVTIILILLTLSNEMIYSNNSFLRIFPSHAMEQQENLIDLKYNSYYIAGTDKNHVYLANLTTPLRMLIANTTLTDTQRVQLRINNIDKLKFTSITVKVDSPYFYITDGVMPGLFRGRIGEWEADRFMNDSVYFSAAEPVTSGSFALRANSLVTHEDFLMKRSMLPQFSKEATNLLQKQVDGVFCTDGLLVNAKDLNTIVYLYFYRNQFIVTDTSLNLRYRANTIDTVSKAKIKIMRVASEETTGLANPSALVNKRACIWKNWLLVNSNLMSRNDNKQTFNEAAVIDVYDLHNQGAYKFSFRLYNHDGKRMHSFMANPEKLFVINGRKLISYKPAEKYFTTK